MSLAAMIPISCRVVRVSRRVPCPHVLATSPLTHPNWSNRWDTLHSIRGPTMMNWCRPTEAGISPRTDSLGLPSRFTDFFTKTRTRRETFHRVEWNFGVPDGSPSSIALVVSIGPSCRQIAVTDFANLFSPCSLFRLLCQPTGRIFPTELSKFFLRFKPKSQVHKRQPLG